MKNVTTIILFMLLLLLSSGISYGWEKTSIGDILDSRRQESQQESKKEELIQQELSKVDIRPLRIVQKMQSVLYGSDGLKSRMNVWIQHPAFHMNIFLNQQFQDLQNFYLTGQSSLVPVQTQGQEAPILSGSEWIQSYYIGCESYVYDPANGKWTKKSIVFTKEAKAEFAEFGIFQSLAVPRPESLKAQDVRLVSIQDLNDKRCYVLEIQIDPKKIEGLAQIDGIDKYKVWVDKESFYPYQIRIEGSIGDAKFLQVIEYYDFGVSVKLDLPTAIQKDKEDNQKMVIERVKQISKDVFELRGYKEGKDIECSFMDTKELRRILKDDFLKDYNPSRLVNEGIIFKWLGFLPEEFDYQDWLLESALMQIAGLYDPQQKKIFISEWLPKVLTDYVVAHEVIHGLQDQKIGLEGFIGNFATLDESYAKKFMLEGEATAVELAVLWKETGRKFEEAKDLLLEIKEKLKKSQYGSTSKSMDLMFSGYAYGARFIQRQVQTNGWQSIDELYKDPIVTTRELLHPEVYFDRRQKSDSKELPMPVFTSWKKDYSNRLGEFILLSWLEVFMNSLDSYSASSGLLNDNVHVFSQGDRRLIFLVTEWKTEEEAKEFVESLLNIQDKRLGNDFKRTDGQNTYLWSGPTRQEVVSFDKRYVGIISSDSLSESDRKDLSEYITRIEDPK